MNFKKNTKIYFLKISNYVFFIVLFVFFAIIASIFTEFMRLSLDLTFHNILKIYDTSPLLYFNNIIIIFCGILIFLIVIEKNKLQQLDIDRTKLLTTDYYTGLKNKYSSEIYLINLKKKMNVEIFQINVVIINIRNLKKINSIIGAEFGDKTVLKVTKIISQICGNNAEFFRIFGNEFMIVNTNQNISDLILQIHNKFTRPILVQNLHCLIELNIGLARCFQTNNCCEGIVDNAYSAMGRHKINQNEPFIEYKEYMKSNYKNLELESMLFEAIKNSEFFIVYQPVIDSKTKQIKGLESLLRWENKKFGVILPSFFIPILERTNLIVEVGLWIFQKSCEDIKYISEKYNKDLFISINVSINQLFDMNFIDSLDKIMKNTRIDKNLIRLEITESISEEKRAFVKDKIELLFKNGFMLSIDDFGTGYSSLSEIDTMPLHSLKVDKSFISKINKDEDSSPVIEMIVNMCHKMNLKVVIEGVETEKQFNYLKTINSDYIQGYYFYKPVCRDDLENILKTSK